jgi:low affinity Fe/Cu permease
MMFALSWSGYLQPMRNVKETEGSAVDQKVSATGVHEASGARTTRPRLSRFAFRFADWTGSVELGVLFLVGFIVWTVVGFLRDFPRWWELVITVGVPAISLLLLTVVQHTQNHANRVTQLKLGELIRASANATDRMITIEEASSSDLDRIHAEFSGGTDCQQSRDG